MMPTKRANNPCTCDYPSEMARLAALGLRASHRSDCLSLYPKQPAPGDKQDPLTRLMRHVRDAIGPHDENPWTTKALDLISEVRAGITEIASANDADRLLAKDAAALSTAIARRQTIPTADMRSSGGIVIATYLNEQQEEIDAAYTSGLKTGSESDRRYADRMSRERDAQWLEAAELRKQVEALKSGQQRASEARHAAFVEMAHELLEMPEAAREMYLQRIVDNAQ